MILEELRKHKKEVSRGITKAFVCKIIKEAYPELSESNAASFNNAVRKGMEQLLEAGLISSTAEGFGAGNKFKLTDAGKKDSPKKKPAKKSPAKKSPAKKASPKKKAKAKVASKKVKDATSPKKAAAKKPAAEKK